MSNSEVRNSILALFHRDPISKYISSHTSIKQWQSVFIPTGFSKVTKYTLGYDMWEFHDIHRYNKALFNDEFEQILRAPRPYRVVTRPKEDKFRIIAGGMSTAFAAGKIVLDLGSGDAKALLQYSRKFPETVFIGVDVGYDEKTMFNGNKTGVQLIHDDWNTLAKIQDQSIDTILSYAAMFRHTIGKRYPERSSQAIATLNRVAKQGAILRFDKYGGGFEDGYEDDEWAVDLLRRNGWNVINKSDVFSFVAIKE